MTDFERWQAELDAAETAALGTAPAAETGNPLSAEDQAVHDLCQQFSEADLLASPTTEAPDAAAEQSLADSAFSFKRAVVDTDDVEEAYQQLLGIADELCEELTLRKWDSSREHVEEYISQARIAHDSGQLASLASSVARTLGKFKILCERLAEGAVKVKGTTADVGELFLLTALSAHELRRALSEVYDC